METTKVEKIELTKTHENIENQNEVEIAKIIHDSLIMLNQIEWQRTHDIESKATGIVGFVGVIFSLTIASFSTIISSPENTIQDQILIDTHLYIFILILVLMVLSIICGIIALNVKNWEYTALDKFIKFCNEGKKTKEDIYTKLTDENITNINKNCKLNDQIANWLKYSYYLFMVSVILLMYYFVQVLYMLR